MADDDLQRNTAKRQIARLIGGSDVPIYVLSEEDQIVFANDALGALLGRDADSLIGWDCSSPLPRSEAPDARLASWLSLPPNVDRQQAGMHSLPTLSGPSLDATAVDTFDLVPKPNQAGSWLRVTVPLELGAFKFEPPNFVTPDLATAELKPRAAGTRPITLCLLKPDNSDIEEISGVRGVDALHASLVRSATLPISQPSLWFLQGTSSHAVRTLVQLQAAIDGRHPVHVFGPAQGPLLEIALVIANARAKAAQAISKSRPPIVTIECRLMDRDLLRSMFEVIQEQQRTPRTSVQPFVILQALDQLPLELIPYLVHTVEQHSWQILATSSDTAWETHTVSDPGWQSLLARLDAHRIALAPLRMRTADIETLIASWLATFRKTERNEAQYRWTREFTDALLAYPWPDDCSELAAALSQATETCADRLLTQRDLPISIRTFPSHLDRTERIQALDLDQVLEGVEKRLIEQAIERCPRNRAAAAKLLGITRSRFLRRLQQLGLDTSERTTESSEDHPIFEEIPDE